MFILGGRPGGGPGGSLMPILGGKPGGGPGGSRIPIKDGTLRGGGRNIICESPNNKNSNQIMK